MPGFLWPSRIGGANFRFTAKQSVRLIKIHGLRDVFRNDLVVLTILIDAIHLNREEHWNAVFLQNGAPR